MRKALALFGLGAIGALTFRVRQLMAAVADLQEHERERQRRENLPEGASDQYMGAGFCRSVSPKVTVTR